MKKLLIGLFAAALAATGLAEPKTIYVDCKLGDYADHDGTKPELAYETIQEGVKAAAAGDTVLVAEGVYDKGGAVDEFTNGGVSNRVFIFRKAITLQGAGADKTFIVGAYDRNPPNAANPGLGPNACRCLCVVADSETERPIVQGFTLKDGACSYVDPGSDQPRHSGGGVLVATHGGSYCFYADIVDCTIRDCRATRGGGARGGTFHRCRFEGCDAFNNCGVARNMEMFNCLVVRNGLLSGHGLINYLLDSLTPSHPSRIVNCTFCNNAKAVTADGSLNPMYNCVFSENDTVTLGKGSTDPYTYCSCLMPSGNTTVGKDADCIVPTDNLQLFAPALDDYRLASTSAGIGKGKVDYLDLIPENYRDKDFAGNPRTTDGTVNVGCYETRAAVPAAGAIVFTSAASVDGHEGCSKYLHAYTETWPKLLRVEPLSSETKPLLYYASGDGCDKATRRYPKWDANCCYMMPPPSSADPAWYGVNNVLAEKILWVDDDHAGGYDGADGSEAKPFETIQDAIAAAGSAKTLVKVKPGEYRKDGAAFHGHYFRVFVPNGSNLRIVSTDGAAATTIYGEEDKGSAASYGRGPNAYGCVGMETAGAVQGFTLADGRAGYDVDNPDGDKEWSYGAAFDARNVNQALLTDSVVTNCVSGRGVTYYGQVHRCWIVGNRVVKNGICRQSAAMSACVLTGNDPHSETEPASVSAAVLNTLGLVFHCSGFGDATDGTGNNGTYSAIDGAVTQVNCVWQGFKEATAKEGSVGNFVWEIASIFNYVSRNAGVNANPWFASRTSFPVLRPAAHSPVIGGGSTAHADYYKYVTLDFEGNPIEFIDGKPTAGAFMRPAPSVFASASASRTAGISPVGTNVFDLAEGSTVTFTATDAETRPFKGFSVNGEIVSTSTTYDYAVPAVPSYEKTTIEAIYGTNWYVKAVGGDDANSGGTWETAKATLEGALTNALSGDVVTAAPGVYDCGKMIQKTKIYSAPTLYSRVVVPEGVILESSEGPEATVIMGKAADVDDDEWHNGVGALRCAIVEKNAVLRGFTLTGGRTLGNASGTSESDDNRGGGVYARNATSAVIENCIITNNVSIRGGGGFMGVYRKCRIVGNRGVNNGGSVRTCRLYDCFVDHNRGSNAAPYLFYEIVNTTLGADNATDAGAAGDVYLNFDATGGYLYNSVVLAGRITCDGSHGVISNTLYSTLCSVSKVVSVGPECRAVPDGEFRFTDDGRPVLGACAAIDAANPALRDPTHCSDTDLDGNPRVSNARPDCGCYEADWKPRYAKIIGRRYATVGFASPEVVTNGTRAVTLEDGTGLTLAFDYPETKDRRMMLTVAVTGEGTLSVLRNGEVWKTFTAADEGSLAFDSSNPNESFEFAFAGDGSADIMACREFPGMMLLVR